MLEIRQNFCQYVKLLKLIISENVNKLYTRINRLLVYSMQGETGDFLMHISERMTILMDVHKRAIFRKIMGEEDFVCSMKLC